MTPQNPRRKSPHFPHSNQPVCTRKLPRVNLLWGVFTQVRYVATGSIGRRRRLPAIVKAIMRHDQGEAHARYTDLWDAQVLAVGTLPHIFANQTGNRLDKDVEISDTHFTTAAIPSDTKPALESQCSRGKPHSGFRAGLEPEETPASRPGDGRTSGAESDRLCPFPVSDNRIDLIRMLESSGNMMLAVARLLASASEVQRGSGSHGSQYR